VGDGKARSNPVHPEDVARACLEALERGPEDVPIGGPEVLARDEVARLALAAVGARPRLLRIPAWMARAGAVLMRPLHPRVSDLSRFAIGAMTTECVAPARGEKRLSDWFRERLRGGQTGASSPAPPAGSAPASSARPRAPRA
jgi:nucleoside-diphosphate-sugar epimerase